MLSIKSLEEIYEPRSKEWDSLRLLYDECSNQIYRLQNIKRHMDKFTKNGFCDDPFPKNYLYLCNKFEVEIAILQVKRDEVDKQRKLLWRDMEGLFKITPKNSKLKKITPLAKRQLERELCSICYEQHTIKQLVTTNCGHTFGKCCLSEMLEHNYDNVVDMVCPCCRNDRMELIRYA
uniref:RING-type domain-containing protein n=1 Tax=viral metagenome TaxID=1070528 RepID=A0A6C0E3K3_9ZZZZ